MVRKSKLEHYRQGYPRLTAFLNLDPNFTVFKRFNSLHIRVLLEQQDRLTELEQKLEDCDDAETIQLNLSSRRQDSNRARRIILQQLKTELEEYDNGVLRFQRMVALPGGRARDRRSVYNWVNGNKPVVRSESTSFLDHPAGEDHISLNADGLDRAGFEHLLDHLIFHSTDRKTSSDDPNVFIVPIHSYRTFVNAALALLIAVAIICPALLLYTFEQRWIRATFSAIFVVAASLAICFVFRITKYKLLVAVVAYAAVLSAFLSNL